MGLDDATLVFIHGGWVTATCWDPFISFFQSKGYRCLAPAWPGKDRAVDAIRRDPSPLAGLGIAEIIDHYERIVRALEEPPILVGHSFGGLFVQVLLDRGLGAAGIAIDSAPPRGVLAFYPTSLLSVGRVLVSPFGWRRVVRWSFTEFRYAFVHTLGSTEARAIWEAEIVPDSGRPFFQTAFSMFDPASPARVDFANPNRAPLLLVAGTADHAMPAALVRRTFRAYQASPARTDIRELPGRTHWLIAQDGWEEVAQACSDWISSLHPRTLVQRASTAGEPGDLGPETRRDAAAYGGESPDESRGGPPNGLHQQQQHLVHRPVPVPRTI